MLMGNAVSPPQELAFVAKLFITSAFSKLQAMLLFRWFCFLWQEAGTK